MISLVQDEKSTEPQTDPDGRSAVSLRAKELAERITASKESPQQTWDQVFREQKLSSEVLSEVISRLHFAGRHDLTVEGLLSSIRNDHAQPWTYDVLAIEMKLAGRPSKEIDRVLQSRIDFVPGDLAQVMVTIAMLSRFDANDQAMELCRKAAASNPEMPEPWLVGRNIADKLKKPEAQVWARCGILQHVWLEDYVTLHDEARKTIQQLITQAEKSGQQQLVSDFREQLAAADQTDLKVTLKWAGTADLDLAVTEPGGVRCDFRRRITPQAGRLVLTDGGGSANSKGSRVEEYVCPVAANGDYEVRIRFVLGNVVAGTAILEIVQNANSPNEVRTRKTITLTREDSVVPIVLKSGRRK